VLSLNRLAAYTAVVVALGVAVAQATETAHTPLVLTAFSNGVGGEALMTKRYDDALAEIRRNKPQSSMASSAKANNLCVALTAARQLTEAKVACTNALTAAKYEKLSSQRFTGGLWDNTGIAIAYSNRAVMYALSQDMASAKADLERAHFFAPKADYVARNLMAAAMGRSTIAQLDVSTR
jgi:hypothetical protein